MRTIVFLLLGLMVAAPARAQLKKTLHQTFEVPDSATCLIFQLYAGDTYSIEPWAGNNIMTESQVSVFSSTQSVFDHLIENGRYKFEAHEGRDTFSLTSFDPRRLTIRAAGMQAFEEVEVRIFIPDSFRKAGDYVYSRPKQEVPAELVGKAPLPRKKLEREKGEVSEALKESLEAPTDSLEQQPLVVPPPDTSTIAPVEKRTRRKKAN